MAERNILFVGFRLAGLKLEPCYDHARDPEENNVRRSHQNARGIKLRARLVIHRFISPQPRGKPGIKRVRVLGPTFTRRFDLHANLFIFRFPVSGFRFWIPCRYPVSPPDLAANAPVVNIVEPLRVNFFPMYREEADQLLAHHGERFLRLWIMQEPLRANAGLDRHIASIAEADVVFVRLLS